MLDSMETDLATQAPPGYYECAACGRRYKSAAIPEKCAVCGAANTRRARPAAARPAEPITEKFRLAVERAKGNLLD
jgi:hypothetical protein